MHFSLDLKANDLSSILAALPGQSHALVTKPFAEAGARDRAAPPHAAAFGGADGGCGQGRAGLGLRFVPPANFWALSCQRLPETVTKPIGERWVTD